MKRYYWSTKASVKNSLTSNITSMEELFAQESERVLSTELIEVEGPNMISCPPHYVKIIHALKMLKEIERSIDNGDFLSLEDSKNE